MNQDPWAWVDQQNQQNKPLTNTIAPLAAAQDQAPAPIQQQDPLNSMMTGMAVNKGVDATAQGIYTGVKTGMDVAAENAFQAADAAQLANQGLQAGQITSTLGATSAPLSSAAATGLGEAAVADAALAGATGATAAGTGALAAGTTAGAAGAGAGAAGTAALGAMGPLGWAALGYMGGKALKLW